MNALTRLRRALHRIPEAAGLEKKTAGCLEDFLSVLHWDGWVDNLGGHGLALVFEGKAPGETWMVRADMDAVPVREKTGAVHASTHDGLSHACGHDGHMAILAGLCIRLSEQRPERGRVVALFQPAEETGKGAQAVLDDPRFGGLRPDRVVAIHNLPGYATGEVVLADAVFAMASTGLDVTFRGVPSHAAWPEAGRSPLSLVSECMACEGMQQEEDGFSMATLTHMQMGEPGFGVRPGDGHLQMTLRSDSDEKLAGLVDAIRTRLANAGRKAGLAVRVEEREPFPATRVDGEVVERVRTAAKRLSLPVHLLSEPMRWSEDFGWFTKAISGALVGLGSGEAQPQLHHDAYDFPDSLLPTGVGLLETLIRQELDGAVLPESGAVEHGFGTLPDRNRRLHDPE